MKVYQPKLAKGLSMKKRRRHSPEQIVKKLRDADALLGRKTGTHKFVRGVLINSKEWFGFVG